MRARMSGGTGAAVRKLRLARGLTLAALSEQTGIPLSTLSRVELGQNALNYEKLVRLCRALQVDLDAFMAREAQVATPASGRRSVIRSADGVAVRVGPHAGRKGASDLLSKGFTPVLLEVAAGSLEAHGPLVTHPGEAYLLVISGQVTVHGPLYAPLVLDAGEAVYFDAAAGYALIAAGGPARSLLVASGEPEFAG